MDRTPSRAIALEFDGESAPRISAAGSESLAEEIIAIARAHGVPLVENPLLAGLLSQLDPGEQIPETLYRCVAQIIAFAYRLSGRFPRDWDPDSGEEMQGSEVWNETGLPLLQALRQGHHEGD